MHDLLMVLRTLSVYEPGVGRRVLRVGALVNIAPDVAYAGGSALRGGNRSTAKADESDEEVYRRWQLIPTRSLLL